MKYALTTLASNATSITCVIFAGLLCLRGHPAWFWFLMVGFLTSKTVNIS